LTGRKVLRQTIDKIGRDMAAREPWGTLLTNHQSRFKGYDFVDAEWSDIIMLEDLDQTDGRIFRQYYDKRAVPMVLDEDRYEHWRNPKHDRYFFRRLMWASLFSGGHATYGGLRTYEPYGVGKYQACKATSMPSPRASSSAGRMISSIYTSSLATAA
ncbi:MAG: apiosidase-like domain-containing protein, partial [Planctomycetota bacterium]